MNKKVIPEKKKKDGQIAKGLSEDERTDAQKALDTAKALDKKLGRKPIMLNKTDGTLKKLIKGYKIANQNKRLK